MGNLKLPFKRTEWRKELNAFSIQIYKNVACRVACHVACRVACRVACHNRIKCLQFKLFSSLKASNVLPHDKKWRWRRSGQETIPRWYYIHLCTESSTESFYQHIQSISNTNIWVNQKFISKIIWVRISVSVLSARCSSILLTC